MPSNARHETQAAELPRPIHTASFLQQLNRLRADDEAHRDSDPRWALVLRSAATLVEFEPHALLAAFGIADGSSLERLREHAEPTRPGALAPTASVTPWEDAAAPTGSSWRLTASERRRALREAQGVDTVRAARQQATATATGTAEQRIADALLFGTLEDVAALSIGELAAAIEARSWYDGVVPGLPAEELLRARLALAQLLEPMRRLIGQHFVGRSTELGRLSDYVGVLGPQKVAGLEVLGQGLRVLRRARRSLIDNPPLYVCGPGGVGKSSLLARFILDHMDAPQRGELPFVMLDFDRAQVESRLPLSLLVAALQQLRVQFPAHAESMQRMAQSLMQQMRSTDAVELSKDDSSQAIQVQDFARQIDAMLGGTEHTAPLLWVLDTFEEPQRLGESTVGPLWELMNTLQQALPRLRLVVCGRVVPPGFKWDTVPLDEFDEPAARAYLRQRLAEAKPDYPKDDESLGRLIKVVGRTPLALRLTARLIASGDDQLLNLKLRRERIQAVLFHRVLDHIRVNAQLGPLMGWQRVDEVERKLLEKELVRLVFPGLAVRRITHGVIEHVLAEACEVPLRDEGHAARLFGALAQQVDIVEPGDSDDGEPSLLHRTDVRRMMLRDLEDKAGEALIRRIDRRAVRYHAGIATLAHCAEEIYHRLRLQQSEATIRSRWEAGLERYLLPALDEIASPATRVLLAELLGVTLDASALEGAEQDAWERQAERRVRDYLRASNPQRVLEVLRERSERSFASPLLRLEVQALLQLGLFDAAAERAWQALTEAAAAGDLAAGADSALLLAQAAEAVRELDRAAKHTQEARDWAGQQGDPYLLLRALAATIRLARKRGNVDAPPDGATQYAAALLDSETLRGLRTRPALLRELVGEMGDAHPRLLRLGLDVLGIDLPFEDDAQLWAQTLADWPDGEHSAALMAEVAEVTGVAIPPSGMAQVEHWFDWLWKASPKEVGNLFLRLLKDVPTAQPVRARLMDQFRRDVERRLVRGARQRTV